MNGKGLTKAGNYLFTGRGQGIETVSRQIQPPKERNAHQVDQYDHNQVENKGRIFPGRLIFV
jgi:hypothetical protein